MAGASGRVIVVTGATRGLGRAMVGGFVESSHRVIGCGRSLNAVKSLESDFGKPHRFDCVDVSDDAQVSEWAASVILEFGPPDLLLNNAAIVNKNAPLWDIGADEFSAIIDVNIKGVANVIRHFVPAMIESQSGIVVNFSSGWGRSTSPEVAPYCTTKWGIEGMTKALAQELPDGMAAVPLNPGIIDTEMLRSCFGESASSFPNAEDWSKTAVPFLLGLSARDNGESVTVPV